MQTRRLALALIAAGLVCLIGSGSPWADCSTTGCDGFLMAFSTQSGIEFGHGIASGLAGALLAAVGLRVHHAGASRAVRFAAIGLSAVILLTVAAFVVGVYVLNGTREEPLHLWGIPALGAFVTAGGGLTGLIAGWRLRPPT
jgi:uncharacterized membrane protein YjjP (DUF1212 family)